jgi:hypothetical protein
VTVDRTIQLPAPRSDARPGLDALTNQVVQQRVDRHKLVGAPPQETAEWQARVDQLQADHDKAVQDEVARLAREAPASGGNDFSTQLVPMITALTGLIGAIATLVVALRGTRQT